LTGCLQVSTLTLSRRHKGKKAAYVRPIKASDERTLENAIIMANQLASKSMHDLDKRCVDDMFNASPQASPVTPNSSTKKFTFKFPSSGGSGSSGKHHHHGRSSSPPNKGGGGGSRHHHNHHFSDDVNAHTDLESMITPKARDAYRSLIEGGGSEKAEKQPEPNSPPVHYRSETLTLAKTFSAPSSSHRLSLPPSASTFSRLADHGAESGEEDGAGGAAPNPLPLPPKDRKSSVTAGKRHVRKNPLIIASGAAASMARRAEDSTGMRESLQLTQSFHQHSLSNGLGCRYRY